MTSLDKPLPLGLAIGPMRTGSSWLHEYLSLRNDVCLPNGVKETFYFNDNYSKGEAWYRNYFRHYDPASHHSIIEVCPTVFNSADALARIRKTLHEPVLMATLRDPVDRTWSHYLHMRQYGHTDLDFDAAVLEFPSIVTAGFYAMHLASWVDAFGRDKIRIAFYDDLKERQAEYVRKIDEAFGLPQLPLKTLPRGKTNSGGLPYSPMLAKIIRRTKTKLHSSGLHWVVNAGKRVGLSAIVRGRTGSAAAGPKMSPDTHSYLVEKFSPDVENLERMLDISLDSWRQKWNEFRRRSGLD
jgi:hypothetical protein